MVSSGDFGEWEAVGGGLVVGGARRLLSVDSLSGKMAGRWDCFQGLPHGWEVRFDGRVGR